MQTQVTLPDQVVAGLERLEAELGRPIEVRNYRRRAAQHLPVDTITVVSYGNVSNDYGTRDIPFGEFEIIYDGIDSTPDPASAIVYNGEVVGEITPGAVYSYLGLGRAWALNLTEGQMETILFDPIRRCADPALVDAYEAAAAAAAQEALEAFSRNLYDGEISNIRANINQYQNQITSYADALANSYSIVRREQDKLDAMLTLQSNDGADRLIREYDLLKRHARVAGIRFTDSQIVITTSDDIRLHDYDQDESRWLGSFEVKILVSEQQVWLRNLTTQRGGRDHPHVVNQRPCFGGHEMQFAELLSKGELYTLYELLIQYLETYNRDDEYGRYGSYWFDVPDERPVEELVAA